MKSELLWKISAGITPNIVENIIQNKICLWLLHIINL